MVLGVWAFALWRPRLWPAPDPSLANSKVRSRLIVKITATLYTRSQRGWRHDIREVGVTIVPRTLPKPYLYFRYPSHSRLASHSTQAALSRALLCTFQLAPHGTYMGTPCRWHTMDLGTSYQVPPLSAFYRLQKLTVRCRGVGGSGHGTYSSLKQAGGSAYFGV